MIPTHLGAAGLCEVSTPRLLSDFSKQFPVPHPARHPQPAHTHPHSLGMRNAVANFSMSAANSVMQPFSSFALTPIRNPISGVTMATPVMPYPAVPFPPFSLGSPGHEIPNLGFFNSVTRGQSSSNDPNKTKTPINRNYLELAMLVCNTFRGKLFPCPHCRYVTDRRNNLKRHISTMHQACDKHLECCGVAFSTKASLREHIMIFHHNGYSCPYCGRRFCRKALLKRHLSVHSGQKDYTCPCCDYATSHKSNLERHKRIHDRIKMGEDVSFLNAEDFPEHSNHQSPDTTGNSSADNDTMEGEIVDIDTDDSSEEIDVTDDNSEARSMFDYSAMISREKARAHELYGVPKRDSRETIGYKDYVAAKCDSSVDDESDVPLNLQISHSNDNAKCQE